LIKVSEKQNPNFLKKLGSLIESISRSPACQSKAAGRLLGVLALPSRQRRVNWEG